MLYEGVKDVKVLTKGGVKRMGLFSWIFGRKSIPNDPEEALNQLVLEGYKEGRFKPHFLDLFNVAYSSLGEETDIWLFAMFIKHGIGFPPDLWDFEEDFRSYIYNTITTTKLICNRNYDLQKLIDSFYNSERVIKLKYEVAVPEELQRFYVELRNRLDNTLTEKEKQELKINITELKNKFGERPEITKSLDEFLRAVYPSKRLRVKGKERVDKYWNLFLYNLQLKFLQKELSYLWGCVSWIKQVFVALPEEKFFKVRTARDSTCEECLRYTQKNAIYYEELPFLKIHRGCSCYLIPVIK